MHPPELLRARERGQFDPVVEGGRHGLSRELSLEIWERACAAESDSAGRRDEGQAWQRFHDIAVRIVARGERLRPDVGRVTRVGVELDGSTSSTWGANVLNPRTPGRETLVTVEARRWANVSGELVVAREDAEGGEGLAWISTTGIDLRIRAACSVRSSDAAARRSTRGPEPGC